MGSEAIRGSGGAGLLCQAGKLPVNFFHLAAGRFESSRTIDRVVGALSFLIARHLACNAPFGILSGKTGILLQPFDLLL